MTRGIRTLRPSSALPAVLLLAVTACDFLDVENLTAPDREDATANPEDLEAFIAGGFHPNMFSALHDDEDATAAFPLQAAEFSATMQGQNTLLQYNDHAAEPRGVHDNGVVVSLGNGPQGPRDVWSSVHEANSIAHDGLEVLDQGVVIMDGNTDVTARARAFAKLIQGWSWGYLGLVFDEAHVVPETVSIPNDPNELLEVTLATLVPYDSVISAAVFALEEAVQIAQANPDVVSYPSFGESNLWFGTPQPVSNAQFIELANTLAARFLVLSARNPTERDQEVDWNRVLAFTAQGLTTDFEIQLALPGSRNSRLLNHFTNAPDNERNYRWDYRAIGPADQSGAYQTWISSPLDARDRFDIVTPDRRITGPDPQSNGSYTAYHDDDNGFVPERGRYAYTAYQWRRHAWRVGIDDEEETGHNTGSAVFVSVDENNLLRAEAYARTGGDAAAADLINISRTRTQTIDGVDYPGLPGVTASGVPTVLGECVPRLDSGACGDLLAAIRYERMIELAALDMIRGYADSRGWGTLPDGTPFHYPVPGNALDLYGMDNYTYGGSAGTGSATYGPVP